MARKLTQKEKQIYRNSRGLIDGGAAVAVAVLWFPAGLAHCPEPHYHAADARGRKYVGENFNTAKEAREWLAERMAS